MKSFILFCMGFALGCAFMKGPPRKLPAATSKEPAIVAKDPSTAFRVSELRETFRTGALFGFYAKSQGASYEQMTNAMELGWLVLDRKNKDVK